MNDSCLLEVAANSVASALAAQAGGAGRVELCSALELGGLTPSPAQIALTRERLRIPLYVLIRPRAGDFLYSGLECAVMLREIEACAAPGCDGVVLGVLDADGRVDVTRCRALIAAAGRMGVTFHRAFDLSCDHTQALEDVVALGCERVLTSGAQVGMFDGVPLIRTLIQQAAERVIVMPGAGINAQNIAGLATATGARELHASAKQMLPSGVRQDRPELAELAELAGGKWRSDAAQVRDMVAALAAIVSDAATLAP